MPSVTATDENTAFIRTGRGVNLPEMSRAPPGEGLLRAARLLGYCYAHGRNTLSSKHRVTGTYGVIAKAAQQVELNALATPQDTFYQKLSVDFKIDFVEIVFVRLVHLR